MTTYKGINGFAVQSVATDPSPLDEGQVWYNNATYAFKLAAVVADAWASGGSLGSGRYQCGTAGTQTALIAFNGAPTPQGTTAEKYNGTTWSPGGNLPSNRVGAGSVGLQTAAIIFGGSPSIPTLTNNTSSYDGTSWTSLPGTMNTTRSNLGGAGTQTAALGFGGYVQNPSLPATPSAATESWNGSTWTSVNSMNTSRQDICGFGTQTAAIGAGGPAACAACAIFLCCN